MHVFAALLPPEPVRERVASAVAQVSEQSQPSPRSGPPGRHSARRERPRWGRRRTEAEPGSQPAPSPRLDLVPAARMHLPVTKFGNLTEADAIRLADAIEREAVEWGPVLLGLAAGVPPEDDVPRAQVTIELDGDAEALDRVIRGVPRIAQGLQLFVDRRVFRPFLAVGSINDLTTPEHVDAVLDAIDTLSDVSWQQTSLSLLLNVDPTPDEPGFKTFREVQLGRGPG